MNLLPYNFKESNDLIVDNFRKYQYDNLKKHITDLINFISFQNNDFLQNFTIDIYELVEYFGAYNSQFIKIEIKIIKEGEYSSYFNLILPKLLDGYMYYLNGNYYTPALYVIDYPIIMKKDSFKLTGLINSITFQLTNKFTIVIFTGVNISMDYFVQLFLHDDKDGIEIYKEFINKYKMKYSINFIKIFDNETLVTKFKNIFKFSSDNVDIKYIRNYINNLFFDKYTQKLYENCYNIKKPNITDIIKIALIKKINNKRQSFIDLKNKRIVFIESLFEPLYKKISYEATNAKRGFKNYSIDMNPLICLKFFQSSPIKNTNGKSSNGLSGNYNYNSTNLYSGITKMKINMIPPNIANAPSEVKDLHPTHKGIICPVTISSQNPGATLSVLPGTKLDEFGRFIFK